MNADGKIYIYITDKLPGGDGKPGPDAVSKEDKKESTLAKYAQHRFFNFLESEAKQIVNYEISNIGNFTGNYVAQRKVQTAVSAGTRLLNIGNAAVAGFVAAGPVGAIIGASLAIATSVITYFEEERVAQLEFKRQNYNLSILKERSGLYALDNESRTGGY